jgi:hypothetical protein
MAEYDKEVISPISSRATPRGGFGPGSNPPHPLSPGARSHPSARSRADQSGPGQPPTPPGPPARAERVSRHSELEPRGAQTKVTGLEEND